MGGGVTPFPLFNDLLLLILKVDDADDRSLHADDAVYEENKGDQQGNIGQRLNNIIQ